MTNTRRIERSPGGGGHTVTIGGRRKWIRGSRAEAITAAVLDLDGQAEEMARAVLNRCFAESRGQSAAVEVVITVAAVR